MPRKTLPAAGSEKTYRSISEVSDLLSIKPHVLRYWETQFTMLKPRKNRAGNRMYRPEEIKLLYTIKELLYARRYTIAGARKTLLTERKAPTGQMDIGFKEAGAQSHADGDQGRPQETRGAAARAARRSGACSRPEPAVPPCHTGSSCRNFLGVLPLVRGRPWSGRGAAR